MSDEERERDEPEQQERAEDDLELQEEDTENVRGGLYIKVNKISEDV
jgi:hypothetical protein